MRRRGLPILVADLGGTKTIFALASGIDANVLLENIQTYSSNDYASFDTLLDTYLASSRSTPRNAVLAVAGPVLDGRASITNLPWELDIAAIKAACNVETALLINDLEGLAWSIPTATSDDTVLLQAGRGSPGGPIGLIAPGTGLGEAFLTWNSTAYQVHPTEGGHADFAPCNDEQARLLTYLQNEFGHVSVERVCSGTGLANIYRFLLQESGNSESRPLQSRLEVAKDVTPLIIAAALSKESLICEHAVQMFVDSLAAEAGSMALRVNATGGIYLGGGLTKHLLPYLQSASFIEQFSSKGRFSEFLRRMPIFAIQDPHSALRGAALVGMRMTLNDAIEGRHS